MVRVITDTTATLPAEVARRYDIPIIPQVINFGTQSFLEGIDIDNAGFLQRLKSLPDPPKTAAPPPELFVKEFQRLVPLGEPILCIHPTSEASGTVRSALLAKAEFPNADIRVIDTRTIAAPLATMVTLAAEWAAAGESADSIETRINALIPRVRIYFVVATLEYLARGGRIGGATALLGSVLRIKPILCIRDGRVEKFEQERTKKRAVARLEELAVLECPRDGSGYLTALHAGVPTEGQALANDLATQFGLPQVPVLDMPPAIITHGGPGILGVSFFAKG